MACESVQPATSGATPTPSIRRMSQIPWMTCWTNSKRTYSGLQIIDHDCVASGNRHPGIRVTTLGMPARIAEAQGGARVDLHVGRAGLRRGDAIHASISGIYGDRPQEP